MNCPLCNSNIAGNSICAVSRNFFLCDNCKLIFVDPEFRLTEEEERKRYSFHQNNINDEGYVKFLNQIINPVLKELRPGLHGLDFGCGPDPVLAKLVKQRGFKCDYYDPYFFPEFNTDNQYDFIFATECFEHFFSTATELTIINSILKPGGVLAVMTEFWADLNKFSDWYYIKDPTHVCFYNYETLNYISQKYGFEIIFCDDKRVVVMRKGNELQEKSAFKTKKK